MKKLILSFIFYPLLVSGQVGSYRFAQSHGQFEEVKNLPGAIVTKLDAYDDYVLPSKVGLPFSFYFNGEMQDSLSISDNGFVVFGELSVEEVGAIFKPLTEVMENGIHGLISGMGEDLFPVMATSIKTALIGKSPNRHFIIEWLNISRAAVIHDSLGYDTLNFQVKLYETSNKVEIVYGKAVLNGNVFTGPQVGLRGADISDFNNRTTLSDWGQTAKGNSPGDYCGLSTSSFPVEGLTFSWVPENTLTVKEQPKQHDVLIYPNPAGDVLRVALKNLENPAFSIYNVLGRKIISGKIAEDIIDVQSLTPGMYFLKVFKGNRAITRQFVKI